MGICGGGGGGEVEPTAEEKALADIATKRYERYEQEFIPAENEFIDSVQSIDEGDSDLAAGTAAAGSQQAFGKAEGKVTSTQQQAGAAPGSGRHNQAIAGTADEAAASRGQAIAGARRGSTERRLSGLQAVSAIGQGQDAEALNTLSDVAREANRESINDAKMAAANRDANAQALGTVVGAGASAADFGNNNTGGFQGVGASTPRRPSYNGGLSGSRTPRPSGGR